VHVPSKARTFWVKKDGDASWAEVTVDSTMSVARLIKKSVKELGLTGRLSTLTLHVAADKEGKAVGEPLDSRTTVAAAGLEDGASIVIKAMGSAAPPVPAAAGVHSLCAVQSSVQGGRRFAATVAVCRAAGRVGRRTRLRVLCRQTCAHCCAESDLRQLILLISYLLSPCYPAILQRPLCLRCDQRTKNSP
jgi:hypothetical protein